METSKHIPTIDTLEALNELMTSLLKEHGIAGRWETFGTVNEGKMLPGMESSSGSILTEDGRVFTYWTGWDEQKTAPDGTKGWYDLGEKSFWTDEGGKRHSYFEEIPQGDSRYPKPDDSSFLAAKKKLGLA
ncbi:MAG: hypothetical protein HYS60_02330 [Candidatus Wildermuthbacteria bacterium]|nr:hypothetical protein [Candidatus Wildermuthbacteria bacterium]